MTHPYAALSPDLVLDAVESLGFISDARVLALNSYENRVYQVGIDESEPLIAKFYRPGRWSDEAIREEHAFSLELAEHEVPVVAPLVRDGETLFEHAGFRFALFPRRGGRAPEPGNLDQLYRFGQLLGRLHAIGATRPFVHRETLDVQSFGHASLATLLEGGFVPPSLLPAYQSVARDLLGRVDALFADTAYDSIRLHGDCHPGNLMYRDELFHIVDLDDCRMGPAVQDLWMMLAGERHERQSQLAELLDGYQEFHDFAPRELALIEGLRALRLLHHSAWLARRWDDPAFPRAFPWFAGERYWGDQVLALREQLAALDEEPLKVFG
ncbi:serine/threonine protein kinase [Zestomonas carbonaria]|uniref:Stress response kinase A n=1 Tax=Zestomonas carbonaria TaxID=2762745 RepID=A0A7U7EKC7_9GAMM|nr:serine/threonine protein kinase [Pseudomonas carbonaria]CAD5106593.1 Serine/threonine protein kinase RdoA [Pseudomonas carbonaria]